MEDGNLATWRPATTWPLLGSGSARLEITRASSMGCEISMAEVTLALKIDYLWT